MPRYRLRYQATDLEMPVGEFVVGRSSGCNLALDDALVSRRHARFLISDEQVTVEDLGSRNGVIVNGQKRRGPTLLRHLDRVSIGAHELLLVEVGRADGSRHATSELLVCLGCRTPLEPSAQYCPRCHRPVPPTANTLAGATLELRLDDLAAAEQDDTKQSSIFVLLAPIVEKTMRLGQYDKAAQMIGKNLEKLVVVAKTGEHLEPDLIAQATNIALGLAGGLAEDRWFDFLFNFYAARRALMPAEVVDRLHELVRSARYRHTAPLRDYLNRLRQRGDLGASERFTLRRLEGLERVVAA